MGDLKNPTDPMSFWLPPGSRFFPSEQQLICYYLTSKNNGSNCYGIDVIKEVDLYNFDPFNLPEAACFWFGSGGRRRHWYCYVGNVLKERGRRRRAGAGYWKKRRARDIVSAGAGKLVVGTRQSFVFYLGDSPRNAFRTHWVMYEYTLADHHHHEMGSFVLCRVFCKSNLQNCLSENMLSSCGEGSVATVRHVGVQYDENIRLVTEDSKIHDKNTHDGDNKVLSIPTGLGNELDGNSRYNPVSEKDLIAILDEDFIELDDLLSPLLGID